MYASLSACECGCIRAYIIMLHTWWCYTYLNTVTCTMCIICVRAVCGSSVKTTCACRLCVMRLLAARNEYRTSAPLPTRLKLVLCKINLNIPMHDSSSMIDLCSTRCQRGNGTCTYPFRKRLAVGIALVLSARVLGAAHLR